METTSDSFFLLIVEDDPTEVKLLELLLRNHFPHWMYHFVYNGQELFDFLAQGPAVSLVLLDIHLPEKDGVTLLEEIRQIHDYHSIPVIGFSDKASRGTINALMLAGASAFFEKPYTSEQMVELLHKIPSFAHTHR